MNSFLVSFYKPIIRFLACNIRNSMDLSVSMTSGSHRTQGANGWDKNLTEI